MRAPRGIPFFGHLNALRGDILGFFETCERDYGPIVPLRLFGFRFFAVNDPDLVQEMLVAQSKKFVKTHGLRILKPMFGEGLLTSEHDLWRRQRALLSPAFHREALSGYATWMERETNAYVGRLQDGERRDVYDDMTSLTLTIVAHSLFGVDADEVRVAVSNAAHGVQDFFASFRKHYVTIPMFVPAPANRRLARHVRAIDAAVARLIAERRARPHEGDVVSKLVAARGEDGAPMPDRQIRDELVTLFLAGTETCSNALAWAFHLLAQHPDVEAKLCAELDGVLGDRVPTAKDLPSLPYADRFMKELFRVYPTAYLIGRMASEDTTLGGMRIKKGNDVILSQWALHRSAKHFEDPHRFDPDRWLDDRAKRVHKFAYLPFGGGPRVCIGAQFGMIETKLILLGILRRFRFDLAPDARVVPDPAITLRPKDGLPMIARRREAPLQSAASS